MAAKKAMLSQAAKIKVYSIIHSQYHLFKKDCRFLYESLG
jgi:hypothetical protein